MKRFFDRIFPSTARQEDFPHVAGTASTAARSCSECGAAASPYQDWCLECGSRIDDTRTRWHQPAAVVASVALIFLAGLVLALSEVAKDAEIAKAKTVRKMVAAAPAPGPQVPDLPAPQPSNVPTLKAPKPPKTSKNDTDDNGPAPPAAPSDAGSSSGADPSAAAVPDTGAGSVPIPPAAIPAVPEPVARWPEAKKAWTVVLLSTTSKSDAEKFARKAKAKGVNAGILDGSKYKNLPQGIWLVWAGRFKTEAAALKASEGYAKKGFEGETTEYVRRKTSEDSKGGDGNGNSGAQDKNDSGESRDKDSETNGGASTRNDAAPSAPSADGG